MKHLFTNTTKLLWVVLLIGVLTVVAEAQHQWDENTILLVPFDGNAQGGEVFGTVNYVTSLQGLDRAAQLTQGAWIRYTPSGLSQIQNAGTIEFFISPSAYNTDLLCLQWYYTNSPPSSGYVFNIHINSEGRITYSVWNGQGDGGLTSNTSIPLNWWSHVAITWDNTGSRIFINGEIVADTTARIWPSSPIYVYLGFWGTNSFLIDELRISKVARTQDEIRTYVRNHLPMVQNINTGLTYTTIQAAIDAPQTLAGHTLVVSSGILTENVTVNKSLTIRGAGIDSTIVQASNSNVSVFTVTANNVSVKKLTVRNATGSGAAGVRLQSVTGVQIDSCKITNNFRGIQLVSASNNNIANCKIISNIENGILLLSSSNGNQIITNVISNTVGGVGSWTGNGINNGDQASSSTVIENNLVHSNAGAGIIAYAGSNYMQIKNNTVYGNTTGIQLGWSTGCYIENNNIHNNSSYGILIDTAPNNVFRNNIIQNNLESGIGMMGLGQTGNIIERNTILNNGNCGIGIGSATRNSIIRYNSIENNQLGMQITHNPGNNNYGNRIYNNNFIGNTTQAVDESPEADYWDNGLPEGGNHWSNWTSPDADDDGFVDVPYQISGGYSQDNFPYVLRNGWIRPVITTTTLRQGVAGSFYSDTLKATGGTLPYKWSITAGSLPQGLQIDSLTGIISGTPTHIGTFGFTARVTDAESKTATKVLSINVVPSNTFSSQVLVADGYTPDIAYDRTRNTINIVMDGVFYNYLYQSTNGGEIFFLKSTWEGGSVPSITIDNDGNIGIVWLQSDPTAYNVYFKRSTDGGSTFGTAVKINDAPASVLTRPKIKSFGNIMYVVWQSDDNKVLLDKTIDGTTFGTDVQINGTGGSHRYPSIAIDEVGKIHIAWQGRLGWQWQIWYANSIDSGSTFSNNLRVDDAPLFDVGNPSIAVRSSLISVVWEDMRNIYYDIRCAISTNGGSSFGNSVQVNDNINDTDQRFPRVAIDVAGAINVVWQDGRNDNSTPDIYFARSTNNGSSFLTNQKVNSLPGTLYYGHIRPALDVTGNTIWICWSGTDGTSSTRRVYFSKASFQDGTISIREDKLMSMPVGFALYQNYPNPFTSISVISYQLPVASHVDLTVYDILGREVARLVNGRKEAGRYEVQFNASHLSSGVYFYKLQAGSFTSVRKLLLMK